MSSRSRVRLSPVERLASTKHRASANLQKSLPALRRIISDAMPPPGLLPGDQDKKTLDEAVAVFWILRDSVDLLAEIDGANAHDKLQAWLFPWMSRSTPTSG